MNKYRISAIEVLKKSQKPLHVKDITKKALEAGILETDGATPEQSMNANISMDIKTKGDASDFIRVAPSIYKLNINKGEIKNPEKVLEKEKIIEKKLDVESSFTGKGGEHLVCSELLFRGYNASIMSVDVGMDITATKENKLHSIQVKTANENSFNEYNFNVRIVSFEKNYSGQVFYIFILKGKSENNYLILPQYEMERKVHEKAIKENRSNTTYRVNLKIREEKVYLGNRKHDMKYFLNNWDIIK